MALSKHLCPYNAKMCTYEVQWGKCMMVNYTVPEFFSIDLQTDGMKHNKIRNGVGNLPTLQICQLQRICFLKYYIINEGPTFHPSFCSVWGYCVFSFLFSFSLCCFLLLLILQI